MSTPTTDDDTTDDLFAEAATDLKQTLDTHLENTREELPNPDTLLETDTNNLLGALNTLASTLTLDEALDQYRAARKQYLIGRESGAIDTDDYKETFDELDELFSTLDALQTDLDDITTSLPDTKTALDMSMPDGGSDSKPARDEPAIETSSESDTESSEEPKESDAEEPDEESEEDEVPVHTPPSND